MPSFSVTDWWQFLCAAACCNIVFWALAAATIKQRRHRLSAEAYDLGRIQLVLSGIYVFGCAWRSAFPLYDVGRVSLFHSWLSSIVLGRSVATLAELSFVAQWALMLHYFAVKGGNGTVRVIALLLVPLIALAELSCWYAVITTANLGQVFEALLWTGTGALAVVGMWLLLPASVGLQRRMLLIWSIAGAAYVVFMCWFDVPMYWSRWLADQAHPRPFFGLTQGLLDAAQRRIVSYRWADWRGEIAWMSLYFSVAVWASISLVSVSIREANAALSSARAPATLPSWPRLEWLLLLPLRAFNRANKRR
ncbi:MAG TPA: hypothetical protein VKU60_10100 [Chloroflexota bacterium]|nr:hypothetical protein [Chloroflexota bacterium]